MFEKILIANRGEIACRIMRTASRLGIATVAVYSDADARARHVSLADEAIHVGASAATESYLVAERLIAAARRTGAEAVHPGYGFLSENADFVDAVEAAGLVFIGPDASAIRAMGLKDAAKTLMESAGVAVVPGFHGEEQDPAFLHRQAESIGYPVLIKARAGGGGKGMRFVHRHDAFRSALDSAVREGRNAFGDGAVLIEKYISSPRHIEVQVFGDSHGNVVHLYERDCSLQRRHQKVIEEAPAPGMTAAVRKAMTGAAIRAARAIDYEGAGTIEFIVDGSNGLQADGFWFMEMNTRLQVEHPVTEAVTGTDLVEWQLRVAAGEPLPLLQDDIALQGHSFEARLYAEDPANDFLPSSGTVEHLSFGPARIDSGVNCGDRVSPFYDPMIAKLTTHGPSRELALSQLRHALAETRVGGLTTNAAFLHALATHSAFAAGELDTGLIERELDRLTTADSSIKLSMAVAAMALREPIAGTPAPAWRLWSESSERVLLRREDEDVVVRVNRKGNDRVDVILPDEVIEFERVVFLGDALEISRHGHICRVGYSLYQAPESRRVDVFLNGVTERFVSHDPLVEITFSASRENEVRAPMTGSVCAVHVEAGDEVQAGDLLLVLEAMKMEHALVAPRAGTVAAIACAVGTQVADGAALVTLEPPTDEPAAAADADADADAGVRTGADGSD